MKMRLAIAFLLASAASFATASEPVLLNTGPIDLAKVERPAVASAQFAGKRLHLVQFHDAVRPDWFAALQATGVEIVSYIPNNAYLVYGDSTALANVHRLGTTAAFVQGEASYADSYKIQPLLQPESAGKDVPPVNDLYAIQLVADSAANAATLQLVDSVKLAPIQSQFRILKYLDVLVRLPAEALAGIARRPDVVSIRPFVVPTKLDERQDQIVAGNLAGSVPNGPGYLGWLTSKGFAQSQFNASGFAVDVTDSGIDDGTTAPNHFALFEGGILGGTSRVLYSRLVGTPNIGSTLRGCDGHGTLNAHIIGGFDDAAGAPHIDASGFHYGLGTAPFVRVGSSVIFDPANYTFPDFPTLQSTAYQDGARISSNSWGSINGGAYDVTAQAFDALTRDAQPAGSPFATLGNQQMVMVFAAGNSGPAIQTLASPAAAKNVIAVGAAEGVQAFGGADLCGVSDPQADSANDLSSSSSRGPTQDGRRKPELVAPGTHISGGLLQSDTPGTTGQAGACFTGSGICGGPGTAFFPAGQQFFTASSGTSHSAPAVAGGAALLRQWFLNQSLAPPSPAMTRAYLVNSARYLTGAGANDNRWSVGQGMGSIDIGMGFDGTPRVLRDEVPAATFTGSGQIRTFAGTISNSSKPLRVTLAWTDAPGSTTGAAYNNNLDLTVTVGGTTYRGNVFSGQYSASGGAADAVNNLESVFLPAGLSGTFGVTVTAANINSDGVPNSGGALDQDFALVVYNGVESAVPVITSAGTQIDIEGCTPANQAVDPDETVTVEFGLANIGTAAPANLVATLEASGGVLNPGGPQSYGSVTNVPVFRPFQFVASGSCGGTIIATLHLQDGATDLGIARFVITLGVNGGGTTPVSNTLPITIPTAGIADRYPAPIVVSGINGTVTKVTATLQNFTHTFPDDVDILLVGPQGQKVMLMSDAGEGLDVNNAQITFDDNAPFPLPDNIGGPPITTGSYRPTDYEPGDALPAPAPQPPYGTSMSVFNGANPNGTWNLYVLDDENLDGGAISGGWTLSFTTSLVSCCVGPGVLQLSATTFSATEGTAGARVTVTRTGGNGGAVGLTLSTSDGTAHAGSDYVTTIETVTFASGDTTPKVVVIPQLDDTLDEDDETINIQVSNPTGGASLGANTAAVLTIVDNDPPPVLSVSDVSVTEGNSGTTSAVFTLSLSVVSARNISVNYVTANGTASAGSDYVTASGSTQFAPGETSHTVSVTINGDTSNELDETFFLNLTNAVNTTLARPQATGTIVSDDILTVTSIAPTSGDAGGGTNVTITGTTFEPGATVKFGTTPALGVTVNGATQIVATSPSLSPGTLNDLVVTNANAISGTLFGGFLSDFLDVPASHPFHAAIENIFRRGITSGCTAGNFCPNASIVRSQMAIFLLRGEHGGAYVPPAATGMVFADVAAGSFGAAFIEQLYAEGVTGGCATNPLRYCPQDPVTRAQMAVFLLRAKHGGAYVPPPATGIFADVPPSHPFRAWIEQLYAEGITSGCDSNPLRYCPDQNVMRGQMAVFLTKTFP